MKAWKILQKARNNPANVSFNDMVYLVEAFGFVLDRVNGSHHIFVHNAINELVNLQKVGNKAKAYQVRQWYDLKLGDEE